MLLTLHRTTLGVQALAVGEAFSVNGAAGSFVTVAVLGTFLADWARAPSTSVYANFCHRMTHSASETITIRGTRAARILYTEAFRATHKGSTAAINEAAIGTLV